MAVYSSIIADVITFLFWSIILFRRLFPRYSVYGLFTLNQNVSSKVNRVIVCKNNVFS